LKQNIPFTLKIYPDLPDSDVRDCDVGYFDVLDFYVRADLLVQIHYKNLEEEESLRIFQQAYLASMQVLLSPAVIPCK